MPNPNTLDWIHYQDIQIPDVALYQQFQQYMSAGNYTAGLQLLADNNIQLNGKAFVADVINTISQGVANLESRYNTGVTLFLANLTSQFNLLINNLIKKGTWNATLQYTPYNFVIYNQELYMCIQQPPIGTNPTNSTYWLYIGLRGATGAAGVNVTLEYDWNSQTTYQVNDVVVYQNNLYAAVQNNTNVTPGTDPNTWTIFLSATPGEIFVSTTAPTLPSDDTVWFQPQTDPSAQSTTDPIVGQFWRYVQSTSTWDEMYPRTVFTMVTGVDNATTVETIDITIQTTDWVNSQWTYTYDKLGVNDIVDVFANGILTPEQRNMYNNLSISILNTAITLTLNATAVASLPIILRIAHGGA